MKNRGNKRQRQLNSYLRLIQKLEQCDANKLEKTRRKEQDIRFLEEKLFPGVAQSG
jgi:hypothetical protein